MTLSNNWPNGIGSTLGDVLGTCKPLLLSGTIYFVSSVSGNDANDGGDVAKPKATIGGAISAATGGDVIVLMANHAEALAAGVTITTGVTVVGLGSSGGVPTATLTRGFDGTLLTMSGANAQLRNVKLAAGTVASTSAKVAISNAGVRVQDCYIQCGANDTGAALSMTAAASYAEIRDTTFISSSTTTQPSRAIGITGAVDGIRMSGVVVDGGTVGWSNYYAVDLSGFAATNIRIESMTLANGSDAKLISSTTGYMNVQTTTGAGKVLLA